jgi:UDP-N-acetyl-alpha-D-muramoyl-L-alanyl-L-glutamate epimerase
VMSDERSASEANLDWRGTAINHQWSKSLVAEEQIAALVADATGGALRWFSLLRPFSELAICRLFAERSHRYFRVFSSCNAAFRLDPTKRIDGWDRSCPKCRFVALALAPWLDRDEVVRIQGGDVLDDPAQVDGLLALVAAGTTKPFECVGEVAESRVAVRLALESEHGWRGARALEEVATRLRADGAWPTSDAIEEALAPDLALTHLVPADYRPVIEDLAGAAAPR